MADGHIYKPLHIALIVLLGSSYVLGVDGFGGIGSIFTKLKSSVMECCDNSWIVNNFEKLEELIQKHLFGQHIAQKVVVSALKAHFRSGVDPKKALAMSFHGSPGTGKTFLSQLIVDSIFLKGGKSSYVHYFYGRQHFPLEDKANIYKLQLMNWIKGNISLCENSVFVFDEVDKIPQGVLDAVKPFLDYYGNIDGVDPRKAVFIFLSNTGSTNMNNKTKKLWEMGQKREQIELQDFEDLIKAGAFNEAGGFHESDTIKSSLIDHYIPFLPMEKRHVKQCIVKEFKRRGYLSPKESEINYVMEQLTFVPKQINLYSYSGCKMISSKVASFMGRHYME